MDNTKMNNIEKMDNTDKNNTEEENKKIGKPEDIAFFAPNDLNTQMEGKVSEPVKQVVSIWIEDPNILLKSFEIFPTSKQSWNEQINAISRLVILVSLIMFVVFQKVSFLAVGVLTLVVLLILNKYKQKKEGFENAVVLDTLKKEGLPQPDENVFEKPTILNPFSNLMIHDINAKPPKKPAPPIDSVKTNAEVLEQAKEIVKMCNPTFPDIADKLFRNIGDQYEFERSMQPFYSTASTTSPNDQQSFSEFCYGDMISCKEGNLFACSRNLVRHTN
jgi:hypothetical protein